MAAPSVRAVGTQTVGTGAGSLSGSMPTHATDDILLLVIETGAEAIANVTAGWAEVTNSPQVVAVGADSRLTVYWKRATSASETAPTFDDPGDHWLARVISIQGCRTGESPFDATSGGTKTSASTSSSITGVTTSTNDCLILYLAATGTDTGTDQYSAWANASLTSVGEVTDGWTATGNGGGFAIGSGVLATAGATGAMTATIATSSTEAFLCLAMASLASSSGQTVSPGLISNLGQLFAPQINQAVAIGLIASAVSLFAPQINQQVAPGLIASEVQVFAPRFDSQTVSVGLIDQSAQTFAPVVAGPVSVDLIASNVTLFAPSISQPVSVGLIASNVSLFAPQVNIGVSVGLIASNTQVFAPEIALEFTIRINFPRAPALEDAAVALAPAGYWRCDETQGTDALDRVGGQHGTYTGTVTVGQSSCLAEDANLDRSVLLDGSTAYVTIPDATALDFGDTFSFAAAVFRRVAGVKHYLVQKGTNSPGIYIGTDDKVYLEKVGTATITSSTTTVPAGQWTLIVVTKSGSTVRIFLDGIDRTDTVSNQTCASTASALEWGRSAAPGNYFDGRLDELVAAATAWTPAQVSILATAFLLGELGGTMRDVTSRIGSVSLSGGLSSDRASDQVGQAVLVGRNKEPGDSTDEAFWTPERNLVPNASFGFGLHDVETEIGDFVDPGATLKWLDDAPTGLSYSCGVTTAAAGDGIGELLEGLFRSGEPVTLEIAAKAESGTPDVSIGLGSVGTPADVQSATRTLSTSWATLASVTWTPSGDRTDAAWFAVASGGAVNFRVSRVQVNRGSSANAFVDGPTWPMLQPGALAHVTALVEGASRPQIAGHIERIRVIPATHGVEVTVQDAFADLHATVDVSVAYRTHRDIRAMLLDAAIRRIDGAVENRCVNGTFPSDTGGWTLAGGAARDTSEKYVGTASIEMPGDSTATYNPSGTTVGLPFYSGRLVLLSFYTMLRGAADNWSVTFGRYGGSDNVTVTSGTALRAAPSGSDWTRYSIPWVVDQDTTGVYAAFSWTSATAAKGGWINGVMISEGAVLPDFVDFGSPTGRLYNWLLEATASIESGVTWENGWHNHCGNPEFATNTSGWATSTSGFITASGGTITRVASSLGDFATHAQIVAGATGRGARYRMTGKTFYSGVTYKFKATGTAYATGLITAAWGVGDSNNPSDYASSSVNNGDQALGTITWTPSGNRTTVEVWFRSDSGSVSFNVTGIMVSESIASTAYAREGIQSPSALISPTSITAVDDSTIGRKAVEVVTRAVAGSGIAFPAQGIPEVNGAKSTFTVLAWVPSGTASVVVGLGGPFGQRAADVASKTYTLTTTPRRVSVPLTGSTNDLTADQGLIPFMAAASASATTFRIADPSLTFGSAMQPFAVPQADGIDAAETDLVTGKSLVGVDALATMAEMGRASMARQWIRPLGARPWWELATTARGSIASKTVAESWDGSAEIKDISGMELDRDATYQAVTVDYTGAVEPARAQASAAARSRIGAARTKAIDAGDWITDSSVAQEIADLQIARLGVARCRYQVQLANHWDSMLARQPDDLVELNSSRAKVQGLAVELLSRRVTIEPGKKGTAWFDAEEWIPG